MVSIEKLKKGKNIYYYISKNFRIGDNKWKKIRVYIGNEEPTEKQIKEAAEKIEAQAKESCLIKEKTQYKYLSDEQAEVLEDIKSAYNKFIKALPQESKQKYFDDFLIRFTYNSNAIEGNRLSLRDTYLILQDNIMPHDATSYEYNEVINGRKCMEFIKQYKGEVNQKFLLELHRLLTENTSVKITGRYRDHNVIITGSSHIPPSYKDLPALMKGFFIWYNNYKKKLHPLELASLAHTKFTRIHPFSDGNGRAARLISNFMLFKNDYPMFYVEARERRKYYDALDESDKGNEKDFVLFIFNNIVEQLKSVVKE